MLLLSSNIIELLLYFLMKLLEVKLATCVILLLYFEAVSE